MNERDSEDRLIPDEKGEFTLEIVNNAGAVISTFKGTKIDDIVEKLADAQVHANRQLGRLMKPAPAPPAGINAQPRVIEPADRLRLAGEISDPNRVVEAVTEIVTAAQGGVSPQALGERAVFASQQEADAHYLAEANAFMDEYPDYYRVPQNANLLDAELKARGIGLNRNTLATLFEELRGQGRMIMEPLPGDGEVLPPEDAAPPPAPTPRPRSISSGLRSSDANASKPAPAPRKPLVTREEIEKMSRAEYNEKLRNPAFRQAVDALG
jgi:hypothetical protein